MKRIILIISAAIVLCAGAKELALPTVPASLRVPSMRADYIATHFWDSIDWADTMAVDPMQVSQNVANYLSVFPGNERRQRQVRRRRHIFLTRALRAGDSRALAASQAIEDCLFGSGSPQRNEQLYTLFLQRMLCCRVSRQHPDGIHARDDPQKHARHTSRRLRIRYPRR